MDNKKIIVRTYQHIRIVNTEAIVYIRASGRFTDIINSGENEELTTRHSLKELEEMLSEGSFIRCHKSLLVNLRHVKAYDLGCNKLLLANNMDIKVSRRKMNLIRQYFEKFNI
jgi:two-component system, LytTR family, response regulator